MPLTVTTGTRPPDAVDAVGVPVRADVLDDDLAAAGVPAAEATAQRFEGKPGQTVVIPGVDGPATVLVGMGPAADVDAEAVRVAAGALVRACWKRARLATTLLDAAPDLDRRLGGQAIAEGANLAAYRFDRYRTEPDPAAVESLHITATGGKKLAAGVEWGARVADAVGFARDLVNEPAGALAPRDLAMIACELAEREDLAVSVLDEGDLAEAGCGGILGVAQGSSQPPRLIELTYDPPGARTTLTLVGKGITFDSGGLSLKTADGMMTMKTDMSGAAAVLAVMSAVSAATTRTKVVGLVPSAENMPGPAAIRPGDVIRHRGGTTVEVLNTDAEGRLILADALAMAAESAPDAIVDIATLTGACVVALGRDYGGLMGNHRGWVDAVHAAADAAGEPVWPLPLPERYREQLDSEIADLRNIGQGRFGGTLTAGLFLKEFVGDVPWAHLDIAGPARSDKDEGLLTKGGTGFGVRTLLELVRTARKPGRASA